MPQKLVLPDTGASFIAADETVAAWREAGWVPEAEVALAFVGEQGPELRTFPAGTPIVPNEDLAAAVRRTRPARPPKNRAARGGASTTDQTPGAGANPKE